MKCRKTTLNTFSSILFILSDVQNQQMRYCLSSQQQRVTISVPTDIGKDYTCFFVLHSEKLRLSLFFLQNIRLSEKAQRTENQWRSKEKCNEWNEVISVVFMNFLYFYDINKAIKQISIQFFTAKKIKLREKSERN